MDERHRPGSVSACASAAAAASGRSGASSAPATATISAQEATSRARPSGLSRMAPIPARASAVTPPIPAMSRNFSHRTRSMSAAISGTMPLCRNAAASRSVRSLPAPSRSPKTMRASPPVRTTTPGSASCSAA